MLEAILKNITDNQAVLELADGKQITIDLRTLATNISIGDTVIIEVLAKQTYQNKQDQNAKDTLNELLRP